LRVWVRRGYVVGAELEEDVHEAVVLEVVLELDDVGVVQGAVDDYLGLQLLLGLALGQRLLVDHLGSVALARLLRNQLEALREAALSMQRGTLPRLRPLLYFFTLPFSRCSSTNSTSISHILYLPLV
jgi:hypothetical protein